MLKYNGQELPEIGTVMPDGTIYCGISCHQQPLYAMPQDYPTKLKWDDAMDMGKEQSFGGYSDWGLPDRHEIDLLYVHKDKIGGFSARWYWSASEYTSYVAYVQRFGDGNEDYTDKGFAEAVRFVRGSII